VIEDLSLTNTECPFLRIFSMIKYVTQCRLSVVFGNTYENNKRPLMTEVTRTAPSS